ncbi:hypothetical protein ACQ4M4_12785 [Leptolyngbya sp. AN02str]|uniref:hypothetical protein n=1 Tax=Leptolyngbya sp. AN02str TaxID=3423363 RepID=UPI003D3228CD
MPKIEGYLGYLGLGDWWLSTFTAAERKYIEQLYEPLGGDPKLTLTRGKVQGSSIRKAQLLHGLAGWFLKPGDRHIARRILAKAEDVGRKENDILGLHFTYSQAVKTYYKDRDVEPQALEMAIEFCEKQIELAPVAAEAFRQEVRSREKLGKEFEKQGISVTPIPENAYDLPAHVGFEQLAIIREKQKDFAEAIRLSTLAKSQGWAGDWDKRVERCEKRLNK